MQNSGKDLNQDQKTAVARYDEVVQTLDFARDLCKQFLGIVAVSEKEAKKQARKDASAKSQAELAKVYYTHFSYFYLKDNYSIIV